jgi:type II secretory pathway pseudopilin PulG
MRVSAEILGTQGFTLIEIVLIIVVIGIVASIAMRSLAPSIDQARETATIKEMDQLAKAIVGDNDLVSDGMRSDYGYVGDVGALPPNLDALASNPGGYSTWDGPYMQGTFSDDSSGYKYDAWSQAYAYAGGVSISSSGGPETLTKQFAQSVAQLTSNTVRGNVYDGIGNTPGAHAVDVSVRIDYPDGLGSETSSLTMPNSSGQFSFTSMIPIGNHLVKAIEGTTLDPTSAYISVTPGSNVYCELRFQGAIWAGSQDITGGLVGYWKFDETSGTTAYDSSGYNHNGSLTNMNGSTCWVTGKVDGGLEFDGVDDKVIILDQDIFDNTTELTISVWVYPEVMDGNPRAALSKRVTYGTNEAYAVFFYTSNLLDVDIVSNDNRFASYTVFSANQWYHLVVVYDGSRAINERVAVYVNSVIDRTAIESNSFIPNYSSDLVIGMLSGNSSSYFKGIIDDVRIYNRALETSEIQALYAMGN